jgi:hypothetical protein
MLASVGMRMLLFVAAMRVEGTSSCPAPAAVEAQLRAWLPPQAPNDDSDRARLMDDGDDLIVSHESRDGTALGTRRFSRTFSCRELASAVAVAIAAWESDVHPEFAPALAARATVPPRTAAPGPPSEVVRAAPAPRRAGIWDLALGASVGFGGALDVPTAAGDATIGMWLAPPLSATSLRLEVEGQSQRQIAVAGGRADWQRVTAGLGIERPWVSSPDDEGGHVLRWFALARVGWLRLRGEGFEVDHTDNSVDAGATIGVRAVLFQGRWSSWAELAVSSWPIRHDLIGPSGVAGSRLPVVEAFLRIGAGVGRRR